MQEVLTIKFPVSPVLFLLFIFFNENEWNEEQRIMYKQRRRYSKLELKGGGKRERERDRQILMIGKNIFSVFSFHGYPIAFVRKQPASN